MNTITSPLTGEGCDEGEIEILPHPVLSLKEREIEIKWIPQLFLVI